MSRCNESSYRNNKIKPIHIVVVIVRQKNSQKILIVWECKPRFTTTNFVRHEKIKFRARFLYSSFPVHLRLLFNPLQNIDIDIILLTFLHSLYFCFIAILYDF